jgi:hypothetical protein
MGFSAKQIHALKRSLDGRQVRRTDASFPTLRGGLRSQRPTAFSVLTAGTAKRSTLVASLPAKTVELSPLFIPPRCAFRLRRTAQRLFARVMALARGAVRRPAKCTISRSRLQRPTLRSEPLPHSADHLGLSSTDRVDGRRTKRSQNRQLSRPAGSDFILMIQRPSHGRRAITATGRTQKSKQDGRHKQLRRHWRQQLGTKQRSTKAPSPCPSQNVGAISRTFAS